MYIAFMTGAVFGFGFGVAFYYWWSRPDIEELKLHIEKCEDQLSMFSAYVLKSINAKGTYTTITKIEEQKSEK